MLSLSFSDAACGYPEARACSRCRAFASYVVFARLPGDDNCRVFNSFAPRHLSALRSLASFCGRMTH